MDSYKKILIIGAGGALGIPILNGFLDSAYEVSVLSRKESTATFPDGVKIFKADYKDFAEVKAAMEGQDAVISNVGGHAAGDQQIFVDAALATGVKSTPYKKALVDYLRTKENQISWTALITGGFFEWGMGNGFFGFDLPNKTAILTDDGVSAWASTTMGTVAGAIKASLDHADETKNQYVFVSSFHHTQREILDIIEKVDGKNWNVVHVRSEDLLANGKRRVQSGDFAGIMDLNRGVATGKLGLVDLRPHGLWNEKLGLPEEDLEAALKRIVEKTF
ncbi:unnamed protein product [Alternaria alternata]